MTKEDLIKYTTLNGKEYLFYPTVPLDVCFIRATTVDSDGYASMEDEITYVDVLAMAQAVHNNGGLVILQAKRMVKAGTIHPRQVKVPGYLVDIVVINEKQEQLYNGSDAFFTGDYIAEEDDNASLPLDQKSRCKASINGNRTWECWKCRSWNCRWNWNRCKRRRRW